MNNFEKRNIKEIRIMFCNFIKNHIQILVIICLLGLDYLGGIFTKIQFNILWFGVTYDLLGYLLLLIILIEQKKNLGLNNVDSFSLILLVLFHTSAYYSNYSSGLKNIMALVNLLIAIIFSVIFIKNKNKDISQFSIKQIFVLLIGLIVGLCIAIFKIQLNNSDLLILASKNPIPFINSIMVSLSVFAIRGEFIYRGVIWGYLRRKGVNDWWIIVISSLVWVFAHSNIYGNIPELINFIGLGIIFGILVKVTKSINISIGAIAGYSSFLVLQDLIIK